MTWRVTMRIAVSLMAGPLLAPTPGLAQGGGVGVVALDAEHPLLGERLVGGAVRAVVPLASRRLSARLGAERLTGSTGRTGIPCSGLIDPVRCQQERLRDDARMTTVSGGLGFRVVSWGRLAVDLVGDLRIGKVWADTRGLSSGARMSASKPLLGGEFGIEGMLSPWPRLPLVLEAGVAKGRLMPMESEVIVDGYTPFEGGIDAMRLRLGVAWRPGSR